MLLLLLRGGAAADGLLALAVDAMRTRDTSRMYVVQSLLPISLSLLILPTVTFPLLNRTECDQPAAA